MNLNCLSYWFPKLEAAGLPVPKTLVIDMNRDVQRGMFEAFDGKPITALAQDWINTNLRPAVEFVGAP